MWNYDNPFDEYGNYVFNSALFIMGQFSPLEIRDDYE